MPKVVEATLLQNQGSVNDGTWIDVSRWTRISLDIRITGSLTVAICLSNSPTKPADTEHTHEMFTYTANTITTLTTRCKWLKARVSAWTSGSATVYAFGDTTIYGV